MFFILLISLKVVNNYTISADIVSLELNGCFVINDSVICYVLTLSNAIFHFKHKINL